MFCTKDLVTKHREKRKLSYQKAVQKIGSAKKCPQVPWQRWN